MKVPVRLNQLHSLITVAARASGFNALLLFALTVNTNGNVYYNGTLA
jgi:hypothetical protein